MKRIVRFGMLIAIVIAAGSWFYLSWTSRDSGPLNGAKLVSAVATYKSDLKRQGVQVPSTVSLKELIARGLLTEDDVSAFSGMDVTVNLSAEESRPRDVLMRARLPDGNEIVALGDGSVQQIRK